jgi:hypothetical protein
VSLGWDTVKTQRALFDEDLKKYRSASFKQHLEIAAHHAYETVGARKIFAVQQESERSLIHKAFLRQDFPMLTAFIRYGHEYQLGCVNKSVKALRDNGTDADLNEVHVRAAQIMIEAVVQAYRENPDLDAHRDENLKAQYNAMICHGVINHGFAEVVARLITDRKVKSADEMLVILESMSDLGALPLSDGFL